jgi:hypothetical protein
MPRQLGASLQSERGSLPEQRDLSLKFTAVTSPLTASSRRRPRSCRCMCGGSSNDVQKPPMASHAKDGVTLVREPNAGNLHVRFDEGAVETELRLSH